MAVSVDTAALKEAVAHHALGKQKRRLPMGVETGTVPLGTKVTFPFQGLSASNRLSSERPLRK
jgi:hypothetical protein